jgi:hypothetical protein
MFVIDVNVKQVPSSASAFRRTTVQRTIMLMRYAAQKSLTSTSKDVRNSLARQLKRSSVSSSAIMTFPRAPNDYDLTLGHALGTNDLERNRNLSLGLRSSKPPDSVSPSKVHLGKSSKPEMERQDGLSDAEWEIRTGEPVVSSSTSDRANFSCMF